jgi:hypothetical protein
VGLWRTVMRSTQASKASGSRSLPSERSVPTVTSWAMSAPPHGVRGALRRRPDRPGRVAGVDPRPRLVYAPHRLAARIVDTLEPATTIWFHQRHGARPYVRAWGQSVPVAKEFARLAKMPFKLLPWPAGTAPNWQNHRFPGTSSFVVELPRGEVAPAMGSRLSSALVRIARDHRLP